MTLLFLIQVRIWIVTFLLNLSPQEKLQEYPLKSQVAIEQRNTMPKSVVYQIHPTLLESQQILLLEEDTTDMLYCQPLSKQDSEESELQRPLSTVIQMTQNQTQSGLTNTVGCTLNYTKKVD